YAYSRPVILRGLTDNTKFRLLCSKWSLLREYGARRVRLSTANTYSYRKDVPFQEYVDEFLRPQSADALGSTLYFFGDNNFTELLLQVLEQESPSTGTARDTPRSSMEGSGGSSTRPIRSLTSTRTAPPCPGSQKRTPTCWRTRPRWSAPSDPERCCISPTVGGTPLTWTRASSSPPSWA
uniref:Jumonji domain containing 8 n=1 Tax=Neolamprologus brichardi TaxID=32507 RepID=A0A3Q4I1B1_NEOBR